MLYTTLVIDDSSILRLATSVLVKNHPQLKFVGSFQNPFCGIKAVHEKKVDIVFLDVLMEHVDAFELLDNIEINAAIILNSTWANFAVSAFDRGVNDFLMKPMPKKRFDMAVQKAIAQIESGKKTLPPSYKLSEVMSTFK